MNHLQYDLDSSPRSSIYSDIIIKPTATSLPPPPPPPPPPPTPSIRLLFSLLPRRHAFLLLLPAILSSIIAGGIAPFMTYVVGQAFAAFAAFPQSTTTNPTPEEAKHRLLHGVGLAAVQLIALAVGALALSSVTSCLWIWTGERNVMALRKRVYQAVEEKEMLWFDLKMGAESVTATEAESEQGPLGAGGLMAKFTRETDDVRTATSLASGQLLQYLTTTITCLILAFQRSYALTLVILSAVPLLVLIQSLSQAFAAPLLGRERADTGTAATQIDRAVAGVATVKAFTAQPHEEEALAQTLDRLTRTTRSLNLVWGATSAGAQFVMMGMFVQGFWFGAKLVREGRVGPGEVMSVFWACLIATSNLQMCVPQAIALAKGKVAMVELLVLVGGGEGEGEVSLNKKRGSTRLRKIRPAMCIGEMALHNVTFRYPAAPCVEVLKNVSLFLPAGDMTFIVGSSGSGKSTIAQLLVGLYAPGGVGGGGGNVCLDERDVRYLDELWMRGVVCGVGQGWGDVVFDGKSLRENLVLGVGGAKELIGEAEVEEACRVAMLSEFVKGLPEGLDTVLGGTGVALSGGQRQRLAIARARLRNSPVLVLDEATSALDPTSRLLVFEALKTWRKDKTTIVITHDLSQIGGGDFVYVMKGGRVVEQGFRCDLERVPSSSSSSSSSMLGDEKTEVDVHDVGGRGEFRKMLDVQMGLGGFLPVKDVDVQIPVMDLEKDGEDDEERYLKHQTLLRPLTLGNWMFDVVADLTATTTTTTTSGNEKRDTTRVSRFFAGFGSDNNTATTNQNQSNTVIPQRRRRRSSLHIEIYPPEPVVERERLQRRMSLQFTPTSPVFSTSVKSREGVYGREVAFDDGEFESEKRVLVERSLKVREGRRGRGERRVVAGEQDEEVKVTVKVEKREEEEERFERPGFWATVRAAYPTIPYKPLLFFGLFICLLSGAMTPVFSFLLSRLLFEVSTGARDVGVINRYGGIVLGVAGLDGVLLGLKYFVMETSAMCWITRMRKQCFGEVMKQDKAWFDKSENGSVRIVQVLVKDGDDARNLVAVVFGQCVVVVAMLGVGLVWAMVRGWELTLVGLGIAPVFAGVMALQTRLVAGCEVRNKRAREEVAKGYYDAIVNVRGIRAMSFESVFRNQFDKAADKALATGVRGAFVEGCTYGVASGLIYLAEALLFYVGAVLIAKGTYTYLQMVEVLNLVVFTVTIGSQLMAFTQKIAKSVQATNDFNRLLKLSDNVPAESKGTFRPPLTGPISLKNVHFTYPERPNVPVLKNVNLTIAPGECVAIVGASGSGKSTIAALLQRLYEPDSGVITVGHTNLSDVDVHHLRQHVAVVSQHPNLFDASVSENIRYGSKNVSEVDVRRAAKEANAHEFVMGLPKGYDTHIGENAGLISGGQAQRLQIARALARPADVLILDECTSALDPENQKAVLETIGRVMRDGSRGRTTVMVTHKVQVMQMCDRIVVVDDGEVKEQGTFDELVRRKGVFATLASGGEWVGE